MFQLIGSELVFTFHLFDIILKLSQNAFVFIEKLLDLIVVVVDDHQFVFGLF